MGVKLHNCHGLLLEALVHNSIGKGKIGRTIVHAKPKNQLGQIFLPLGRETLVRNWYFHNLPSLRTKVNCHQGASSIRHIRENADQYQSKDDAAGCTINLCHSDPWIRGTCLLL